MRSSHPAEPVRPRRFQRAGDEAIDFFTRVLGCELRYRETPVDPPGDDRMRRQLGVHPASGVRGALLSLRPGAAIELLEYSGPGAGGEPPPNSAHSAGHLAVRVANIDAAAAYLREQPGITLYDGPNTIADGPSAGIRWLFFRAPWGLQLELVEY